MLDAGRLLTAGELGLDRKLGRGTSKQETLTTSCKRSQLFCKGNLYPNLYVRGMKKKISSEELKPFFKPT
jgi:hypothetical protein